MSGPSAPNWAGNSRFIGPTGPAGQNGAAGGLTLFLDSATSTSVPTTGSLLLAPVLTAQTTISFTATNSTVLIAKFPSAVGAIVEETITPGAWDLNIYASASSLTNAPLFYWSLYRVDADGSSNPVLIADGSANEQVITSLTATLQSQSLSIPATLLPAGKRIACYLYARYRSGSRTATFSFRTGSQSFLGTTIVDSAQNWSEYAALVDLQIAGYNISNVGTLNSVNISNTSNINTATLNSVNISNTSNISTSTIGAVGGTFTTLSGTLTGNVSGNVTGNLTGNVVGNISNTNLNVLGQFSITETADVGSAISNYGSYGRVDIAGKGGLGGIVTITADVATPLNPAVTTSQLTAEAKGNYGLITPGSPVGYVPRGGLVSIIARQGLTPSPPAEVTSALFANGEIDLTAYSYGIVPGLIKLISGANAMYAGAVTPITGVIGYNYVFGQFGNNITAGLPPGGIPTVPGENYIYGLNGTVVDNGLYTDTIYNKFGGDLNLNARTCNVSITASNSGRNITLTASNINLNGTVTAGSFALTGNLNMSNNVISNCLALNSSTNLTLNAGGVGNISLNCVDIVMGGNVDMSSRLIFGAGRIQAASNLTLESAVGGNIVLSNIGFFNMNGFSISNVNVIAGCNINVSSAGNLRIGSSTGGEVVCGNTLNMSNNSITNISNVSGGSNMVISNATNTITLSNSTTIDSSSNVNLTSSSNIVLTATSNVNTTAATVTFSPTSVYLDSNKQFGGVYRVINTATSVIDTGTSPDTLNFDNDRTVSLSSNTWYYVHAVIKITVGTSIGVGASDYWYYQLGAPGGGSFDVMQPSLKYWAEQVIVYNQNNTETQNVYHYGQMIRVATDISNIRLQVFYDLPSQMGGGFQWDCDYFYIHPIGGNLN